MGLSTALEEEALRSPENKLKSSEKASKTSKELASNQVLKTTYEKHKTWGATHKDEEGDNNLKRKNASGDSREKKKQSKRKQKKV